jgi:hypothetical protein
MKKIAVLSMLLILITSVAFAVTVNLPRTGQTKCYDTNGTEIPCADQRNCDISGIVNGSFL